MQFTIFLVFEFPACLVSFDAFKSLAT